VFKDQPLNSRKKSKNKRKNKKNNNIEDKADLSSNTIEPSLTFLKSESNQNNQIVQNLQTNFELRTGRQTNTDKVVVPGFPNGLPSQVPEGVKIALASAQRGPDGEFIMPPIPGQAGVDFPVLASVPDTGFDCGAQQFPGIYGDTGADCQVCECAC